MAKNTIYEIAMSYKDKQAHIIDPFFKETPLFNTMPCIEASKGPFNLFEKIKDVSVMELVEYDAPVPELTTTSEVGYATIGKIGGRLNLPADKCKLIGRDRIIAKDLPVIMNRTGQAFDYTYMYNSLKKFCLENPTDCVTKIGNTGSGFFSMIGITWGEGENCGLYQPALGGEKMFNTVAMNGGNLMYFRDANGKDVAGYVLEITSYLGIQLPRADRVHALVNINADNIPTYKQLLDFVYNFGGYTNTSYIYCHPLCLNMILATYGAETHHADLIRVDGNGNVRIGNCLIVPDQNMLAGTETLVA